MGHGEADHGTGGPRFGVSCRLRGPLPRETQVTRSQRPAGLPLPGIRGTELTAPFVVVPAGWPPWAYAGRVAWTGVGPPPPAPLRGDERGRRVTERPDGRRAHARALRRACPLWSRLPWALRERRPLRSHLVGPQTHSYRDPSAAARTLPLAVRRPAVTGGNSVRGRRWISCDLRCRHPAPSPYASLAHAPNRPPLRCSRGRWWHPRRCSPPLRPSAPPSLSCRPTCCRWRPYAATCPRDPRRAPLAGASTRGCKDRGRTRPPCPTRPG